MIASTGKSLLLAALLSVALAVFVLSCAPAANEGQSEMAGMDTSATEESDVDLKIGEAAPPFAMTLADGTQVSSASLAENGRPSHLFWFATW